MPAAPNRDVAARQTEPMHFGSGGLRLCDCRTIVILAVRGEDPLPQKDDLIYFEVPAAIAQIESLRAEVHMYAFSTRPTSPWDELRQAGHGISRAVTRGYVSDFM